MGFRRFINRRMKWEIPSASAVANMIVDLWQDFEFATLSVPNLAANDHNAGGTWSITDAGTTFSTDVAGQKTTLSTINGVSSAGSKGLAWSPVGSSAYLQYGFSSAPNASPVSVGFWFYFKTQAAQANAGLIWAYDVANITASTTFGAAIHRISLDTGGALNPITVTPNNWYWITAKIQKNSTCSIRVYDAVGTLVGSDTQTGRNNNLTDLIIGDANTPNLVGPLYIDNVVVDYTTATFPLGP